MLKVPGQTYGGKIDSIAEEAKVKKDTAEVNVYAGVDKGILLPSYVPTETEWEYAALALAGEREYNAPPEEKISMVRRIHSF